MSSVSATYLLWDLDGTLVAGQTTDFYLPAILRVLPDPSVGILSFAHGGTDRGNLAQSLRASGIDPDAIPALVDAAMKAMDTVVRDLGRTMTGQEMHLLPGAHEVLERARALGMAQGVVTGNSPAAAKVKMRTFALQRYFCKELSTYGDLVSTREELLATAIARCRRHAVTAGTLDARIVAVGDTLHDISAARHCGVPIVAVATGKVAKADLHAARPDLLLDGIGGHEDELFDFIHCARAN